MSNRVILVSVAAILGVATSTAVADTTLQFTTNQGDKPNWVMIKDGMVRMVSSSPQGEQVSIYDNNRKTFTVLDDKEKTYMVMDRNTVQEQAQSFKQMQQQMMAQMQERLKEMPAEERQQMEEQMAKYGFGTGAKKAPQPQFTTRKAGRTETVNGMQCEVYESLQDGKPVGQACVASIQSLGLSQADYNTLKGMFAFTRDMAAQFAAAAGGPMPPNPMSTFDNVEGLPIKVSGTGGEVMTLEGISHNSLSPNYFGIPVGYTRMDLSQPMGGPQGQGGSQGQGGGPSGQGGYPGQGGGYGGGGDSGGPGPAGEGYSPYR
jgi:uncharacterized membrane protein YgcG